MASTTTNVRVGTSVILRNGKGEILIGKRKGSHGAGTWAFPGGHLEMGEAIFTCAERETLEETNLHVKAVKVVGLTNDVFDAESKHYITIYVECTLKDADAQPETAEPDKCEGWHWKSWETIKGWAEHHDDTAIAWADDKCFLPILNLVKENPQLKL
ncbi:nudix domain-containing protein [Hypoxylon argillaceum]|nr:nudix domain-containing protein [Hypoxylon argillaceum]